MDFRDSNAAAAANMARAGAQFWSNLQNFKQNQIEKQKAEDAHARAVQDQLQFELTRPLLENQVKLSNQNTQQAENEFAAKHFTPDFSKVGEAARKKAIESAVSRGFKNGDMADIPYPSTKEEADAKGIPWVENPEGRPTTWTLPADKFQAPDYSGQSYDQLPPDIQQALLSQFRAGVPHPDLVTPGDLSAAMRAQAYRETPPGPPAGMVPKAAKWNPVTGLQDIELGISPFVTAPIPGPNGERSGFVYAGGEVKPDPLALKPADVEAARSDIASLSDTMDAINHARELLTKNDNLVGRGPSGGGVTGRAIASAKAALGSTENLTKQRELEMLINRKVLESVDKMKGSLSDRDIDFLKSQMPKLSDPIEVWTPFLDRWEGLVQQAQTQKAGLLQGQGLQLPPIVDTHGQQVTRPTITTKEEFEKLPKGSEFMWNGEVGVKQ